MQLIIDTAQETPEVLRLTAQFLTDHAHLRDLIASGAGMPPAKTKTEVQDVPTGTVEAPPAPPPPPPPPPANLLSLVDSVKAAAKFAPEALYSHSTAPDEYDGAGVPHDLRIHQAGKSLKKDKTWKLRKGVEDALVERVMRELAPRIRKSEAPAPAFGQSPLPVGAVAPVTLPATPQAPPAPGAPPAPPAPPQGETQATTGEQFRTLLQKCQALRNKGIITSEELNQAVASAGAASLQGLMATPHLIPYVDAALDALMMTKP